MKKSKLFVLGLIGLLLTGGLVMMGCDVLEEVFKDAYNCQNLSSHTVYVWDYNDVQQTIPPGRTITVWLNKDQDSIYYIKWGPADLVNISKSGKTLTFRNR